MSSASARWESPRFLRSFATRFPSVSPAGRFHGLRTDFSGGQHFEQVVGIECADHAFRLRAALQRLLLAEQADDQAANGAEVRRAIAVLLAGAVLVEAHIEHPVLTVLDPPMFANGMTQ